MQLPATGSYQLTRPSEIPAVNWDKADSPNGFSSSSIKADWESGEHVVSGAEASYSALHIQQALDNFSHIASHSGYNMSGSILWKDNEAHHPFS
jgi:hypothetical protein